jgi:hypothetical protein
MSRRKSGRSVRGEAGKADLNITVTGDLHDANSGREQSGAPSIDIVSP